MTAEETALEEFREAVSNARWHRLEGTSRLQKLEARSVVSSIARIIRAIRAEQRTDPIAEMRRRLEGLSYEVAALEAQKMLDEAYERGRHDALRGVQGACLFEEAASDCHSPEYYIALAVIADAAEEAAR